MIKRTSFTCLLVSGVLALVGIAPALAHAQNVVDGVRERAATRVQTGTESRANQQVDSAVDKTLDCAFNPVECAKKVPAGAPAPGPGAGQTPPPGVIDATQWYADQGGSRVGPMPRAQLDSMVERGQVTAQTLVWHEGLGGWTAAGQLPELAETFQKVPPPLPGPSGPPPLPTGQPGR